MTRVDLSVPVPLADLLEAAVDDGLFKGASDAARVAAREYFADDQRRLEAITALVETQPPSSDDETLSLAAVVRLTGRLPSELPEEVRSQYDAPNDPTTADMTTTDQ